MELDQVQSYIQKIFEAETSPFESIHRKNKKHAERTAAKTHTPRAPFRLVAREHEVWVGVDRSAHFRRPGQLEQGRQYLRNALPPQKKEKILF